MPNITTMASPSRLPRGNSSLRTDTPTAKNPAFMPVVSETKLVQAIQALDETWKNMERQNVSPTTKDINTRHQSTSSPLSDSLRGALCFLLEIASLFDSPVLVNKAQLETVCTARILGCLKRFFAGCADSVGKCCQHKCEQRLLHLALLCILFRMCREPQIASSVVREGLHKCLINLCAESETLNHAEAHSLKVSMLEAPNERPFDSQDLLISIDPFDWCYQALCTNLVKEKDTLSFFVPVGARSLTCLLRGVALPTHEVSEFELHKSTSRVSGRKRRKLPSIFTFPRRELLEGDNHFAIKRSQWKLAPLCCRDRSPQHEKQEIRALWSVVLNDAAKTHLALRSLCALALHLPRPSIEGRSLLREGRRTVGVLQKFTQLPELLSDHRISAEYLLSHSSENVFDEALPSPSFQFIAVQPRVLKRLALATLALFEEEQDSSVSADNLKDQSALCGRKILAPISNERHCSPGKNDSSNRARGVCKPVSISQRLRSAAIQAHSEYAKWENKHLSELQDLNCDHAHRRLAIRNRCANVESLRDHLMGSLEVLYLGRQHPDPQQEFSEWIKSLPTIETFEHERLYQQEMRHRQALEVQYQREAVHRRERDECTKMQANDYNVPKDSELLLQQEKHKRFLYMQAEMRQLEQRASDDEITSAKTVEKMTIRAKLEQEERQRFQLLENQKREARELERMQREDFYYVERILQAKARAKEEQKKREKNESAQVNAIEEQRQRIAQMRLLDEEKRFTERESSGMRVEDLLGRQMRYRDAEMAKKELHDEWHARKTMQREDQDSRTRWAIVERTIKQQEQEMLKQQRAEERILRRQKRREEEQIKAAWIESWDEWGNKYFYNSITGLSQWEAPI